MITRKQIEEWMQEAELRPGSAPQLINILGERLQLLAQRNEELLSETIQLRDGTRVEELEAQLAMLEGQLDLLKRRYGRLEEGGEEEPACLVLYRDDGRVLQLSLDPAVFKHAGQIATFTIDAEAAEHAYGLLVTHAEDELLALFASGRVATFGVNALPAVSANGSDWTNGYQADTRGSDNLRGLLPTAALPLHDYCVQVSRRGWVKRTMREHFQSYIEKDFIGSGVKVKADEPFGLFFANASDQAVLVSQQGSLLSLPVSFLPYNPEESIKLGVSDHLIDAFNLGKEQRLMLVTNHGHIVVRETGSITPSETLKVKGQQLIPPGRIGSGTRAVALAPWHAQDWLAVLTSTGRLLLFQAARAAEDGRLTGLTDQETVLAVRIVPAEADAG